LDNFHWRIFHMKDKFKPYHGCRILLSKIRAFLCEELLLSVTMPVYLLKNIFLKTFSKKTDNEDFLGFLYIDFGLLVFHTALSGSAKEIS
jgi:hypothetical protein